MVLMALEIKAFSVASRLMRSYDSFEKYGRDSTCSAAGLEKLFVTGK